MADKTKGINKGIKKLKTSTASEKKEIREHLALVLKNIQPLHDTEYKAVFSLPESFFFQKMVCREVLEKIRIRPADYFKALMFLNYFTNVIVSKDYSACDNLENISKTLREIEKKKDADNGEQGLSYLTLEAVVFETGAWMKEKKGNSKRKSFFSKEEIKEIQKRYASEKPVNEKNAKKADAFCNGIGEMTFFQLTGKSRGYLMSTGSRTDIEAVVFSDSIAQFLSEKKANEIFSELSKGNYLGASLTALNYLVEESSVQKIKKSLFPGGSSGRMNSNYDADDADGEETGELKPLFPPRNSSEEGNYDFINPFAGKKDIDLEDIEFIKPSAKEKDESKDDKNKEEINKRGSAKKHQNYYDIIEKLISDNATFDYIKEINDLKKNSENSKIKSTYETKKFEEF